MFRIPGFIAATFVLCVQAQPASQAPNPNQGLIDAKDRLEAQTNLLKAETALLQARIGTLPTGKEGSITVGTTIAYSIGALERVYERLEPLARDVCKAVGNAKAQGTTVLVGPTDLAAVVRYRIVDQELTLIEQDVTRAGKAEPKATIASIGALLGAVESISKLFRSDLTIASNTTTIDARYLHDRVAACLTDESYPALRAQQALLDPATSVVMTRVISLVGKRPQIKEAHAAAGKDTPKASELAELLTRIDKLVTSLIAIPEGQKQPPLADVLLGEAVATAIAGDAKAVVLSVSLADQGGMSMLEKRSFFSDRLYVGGGAIATYRMTQGATLLASGMVAQVDPEMKRVYLKGY